MAKKKKSNPLLWFAGILMAACALGLAWSLMSFDTQKTNSRGCLANGADDQTSLSILIDATEPLTSSQLENVAVIVQQKVSSLQPYDRVRFYAIKETNGQPLPPLFDLCKPDPDSMESSIKKRFERLRFRSEIENELRNNSGVQPLSPIIFSLGSVASQFESKERNRVIVLVSDLIQNSEMLSMYRSDWERQAESQAVNKSRPMLQGIDLQLLWLMRPEEDRQSKLLREWWIDYIRKSGGYVSTVQPITGN